uniref:Uridine diphosphate glucose pyrophosphatase NUDT14 n=1 Tax=Oncorhynchus kisutch TaxID=8019 RepID=A0A8C7KEC2_ONCKI
MEQIHDIQVVPCTNSNYLKPFRVHYNQVSQNSSLAVSVLIFNTTSHCFILVKQFRPGKTPYSPFLLDQSNHTPQEEAVATAGGVKTHQPPGSAGMTYELCAGLVDKADLSLEEIAKQEVLEECGYDVPVAKLRRITSYSSGVGVTGAKQTMFYAEVSDENRVGEGGGVPQEGELIEVVKVPLHEAMTFAYDESIPKTMGVIFSFIWFHNNMSPKYKISTNV